MSGASFLPLLEAAYDLEADATTWLDGIASAAVRAFPHADGVVAYTFDFSGAPEVTAAAGEPEIIRIPALVHEGLPFEAVRAAYGGAPRALPVSWSWARPGGPYLPEPLAVAYGELGLCDGYAVLAPDEDRGVAVGIGMPRPRYLGATPSTLTPMNERWSAFARHARAALRLRTALASDATAGELDASGTGELPRELEPHRARLARCIARAEAARTEVGGDPVRAMSVWAQLLEGRWSIVRHRQHQGRVRYLVVENPHGDVLRRLTPIERCVVERAVTGEAFKVVAMDLGLHESSVANALHRAMRKLGVATRAELIRLGAALARPRPQPGSALRAKHAREDRQMYPAIDAQLA